MRCDQAAVRLADPPRSSSPVPAGGYAYDPHTTSQEDTTIINTAHKARAAALGAVAIALLAGCSSSPAEAPAATNGAAVDIAQMMPEPRTVRAVEVLDPDTIVVAPTKDSDELFGTEFTVHVDNLDAPEDGECGFEEATAAATSVIRDGKWFLRYDGVDKTVHVDANDEHHGSITSLTVDYNSAMISSGYGHPIEGNEYSSLDDDDAHAEASNVGLWAACADFGA